MIIEIPAAVILVLAAIGLYECCTALFRQSIRMRESFREYRQREIDKRNLELVKRSVERWNDDGEIIPGKMPHKYSGFNANDSGYDGDLTKEK